MVEGHADERGTREYNLALGQRRANAARDVLVAGGVAGVADLDHLLRQGPPRGARLRRGGLGAEPPRRHRRPLTGGGPRPRGLPDIEAGRHPALRHPPRLRPAWRALRLRGPCRGGGDSRAGVAARRVVPGGTPPAPCRAGHPGGSRCDRPPPPYSRPRRRGPRLAAGRRAAGRGADRQPRGHRAAEPDPAAAPRGRAAAPRRRLRRAVLRRGPRRGRGLRQPCWSAWGAWRRRCGACAAASTSWTSPTGRLAQALEKLQGDMDFRLQQLEGGRRRPACRAPAREPAADGRAPDRRTSAPLPPIAGPAPVPAAPPSSAPRPPERAIADGQAALARGDFASAEAAAREALRNRGIGPRATDAQMLLADSLLRQARLRRRRAGLQRGLSAATAAALARRRRCSGLAGPSTRWATAARPARPWATCAAASRTCAARSPTVPRPCASAPGVVEPTGQETAPLDIGPAPRR